MSTHYFGEHEICFWKKEFYNNTYRINTPKFTWTDFHLIPESRPSISIPKANYTIAQIPNSNNRVNITDYMPGGQTFESRTGEWRFYIDHDQWPSWTSSHYDLDEYFNGSKMLVLLNNQNDIYEGRIILSSYEVNDNYSRVSIEYDLDAKPITDFENVLFRIRFIGIHNEVLQENLLSYNDAPYYYGSLNNDGNLRFVNWDPVIKKVTQNVDYHAIYR